MCSAAFATGMRMDPDAAQLRNAAVATATAASASQRKKTYHVMHLQGDAHRGRGYAGDALFNPTLVNQR